MSRPPRRQNKPKTKQQLLSQWFTPDYLAAAMWRRAQVLKPKTLLEPSAGTGNLLLHVDPTVDVTAVEIDPALVSVLQSFDPKLAEIVVGDFLDDDVFPRGIRFDLGLSNPPYEDNRDVKFMLKLLDCCEVILVNVRSAVLHRTGCYSGLWTKLEAWGLGLRYLGICVGRPNYGGPTGPMDDYNVLEIGPIDKSFTGRPVVEWIRKP